MNFPILIITSYNIESSGSSAGYRRPGYVVSVEPGLGYFNQPWSFFLRVPVALYRNCVQSFEDKERTAETGVYRHGDAAFADYLINLGVSYRFGGNHPVDIDH